MSSPEEQFSDLFERTHGALLGYAVRRVTDPADAADVVAETYLVAWRRLEDVPPGDQARPWLFGVAPRAGLDRELSRLVAWEELAREDIAVAMGLSRGAVRVRLHRARVRLREVMTQLEDELELVAAQRFETSGHDHPRWATARRGTEEI